MASKKSPITKRYYEVDSLNQAELVQLGFIEEIKAELEAIPIIEKKKPCAKNKKKLTND